MSALRISTRCCTPTGRSPTRASGSTRMPNSSLSLRTWARAVRRESTPTGPVVHSWPSMTFSATVNTGMSMKCWCTMPMPDAHGLARSGERHGPAVQQDLPASGMVEPVEHVHEGRLAGAVLAEQRVDLARLDDEVDRVVGNRACRTSW